MERSLVYNKWLLSAAVLILLGSVSVFVWSASYYALAAPLVFIYLLFVAQNWKAAYWLLLFSIPVSIQLGLMNNALSTSIPDEPMVWMHFVLFFILAAAYPFKLPARFFIHPLAIIIWLQLLWLAIAVTNSQVPIPSIKFLVAKSWYLVCYFLFPLFVFREKKDIKTAFLMLLFPLLLTMFIITVRHAASGYQFTAINYAIGKWYYNHVEYSTILSMFFPLLLAYYPLTRGKGWCIRAFVVVLISFFAVAIFLTYARAALLAVVFAILVGIAIKARLVNMVMPAVYLLIAVVTIYLSSNNRIMQFTPNFEQTYMHHNLTDHIVATFRGEDMSSMERIYRWIAAVRMSEEHPWTGFGPHAFVEHYKPYTIPAFRTYVSNNPERSTTHNYLLLMLTEQGWPAMLLYALLIAMVFATAQRTYHRFKDRLYRNCTLGIAMMIAACFVNNFFSELIETHKIGALFYLSISLLVILNMKSREKQMIT